MQPDIEIARAVDLLPIEQVGEKLGIDRQYLELYGRDKAKISLDVFGIAHERKRGKLILVSAINPTPAGEGKKIGRAHV